MIRMDLKKKLKYEILFWKRENFTVKREVWDWIVSFLVAAAVYFILMPFVLGTSAPAVVVSSCSEAGHLNIGDVVINQGTPISEVNAPEVNISSLNYITPIFENNKVVAINFSGNIVYRNESSDIVTYLAVPSRAQIIHRVFAKVNYNGQTFLITQGDANPFPDQMWIQNGRGGWCFDDNNGLCISTLVNQKMFLGKKIGPQIPIVGHVKLFFCDVMPFCDGHSNLGTGYEYKLWC